MTYKKTLKETIATYDRQIKKHMSFWINYRPSRWGYLLPDKFSRPLLKFIKKKGGRTSVCILLLTFSSFFFGFLTTLNFIWSNIFKVWLFLLIIPMVYWILAILTVYVRVITLALIELVLFFLDNFTCR